MITEQFPDPGVTLARAHTFGAPWAMYSRVPLFRPGQIRETNFTIGRHTWRLDGAVVFPERDELANLHYKYLGVSETLARQSEQNTRLGEIDRLNGWGRQYGFDRPQLEAQFDGFRSRLVDVASLSEHDPALRHWR
jgi:hypothetical protein